MKKLLLFIFISFSIAASTAFKPATINSSEAIELTIQSDYCDGWEDGYCEGWKDVKGQYSICPITPICPIAEIGKDRYRDGYNRGFKAGSRAANK